MTTTPNFGLKVVRPGEDPLGDGMKFFSADRYTLDQLLFLALSGHHHDGVTGINEPPADPPDLTLETTGGHIGAGVRVWYTHTLVNQATGMESGPAPAAFIDTPEPVSAPNAPTLVYGSGSGALIPGQYWYVLSAYTDVTTNESEATMSMSLVIPGPTSTNRMILTLPDLPAGATGFNVYRRRPGGRDFLYLDSVDMDVATPPDEYVDDGSVTEDCDRIAPTRNTTNSTNSVLVEVFAGVVPVGFYWRLYRTVNENDWSASLIADVVAETSEGSGIITPELLDDGLATSGFEPPAGSYDYSSPSKINLTDGSEVDGVIPPSMVSYPFVVTFAFPGELVVTEGATVWRNPFPFAEIISVSASLGRDRAPAADDVIVDVNRFGPADGFPAYTTIFTNPGDRPIVPVGTQFGVATSPDINLLVRDDVLTVDVIQVGGGTTPTDEDLTVTIYLMVTIPVATSYFYSAVQGQTALTGY